MQTAQPGQPTTVIFPNLPGGAAVGCQVIDASTGLVSIGRTTTNVDERPIGSGTFAFTFNAPALGGTYLVYADWNAGAITPDLSEVKELLVQAQAVIGSTGLGAIADYAKAYIGASTWGLLDQTDIARAVEVVKARATADTIATADEVALPVLVLDWLGILAALQLIPAARDAAAQQVIALSVGDDPTEITTYTDRSAVIDKLRDDLARRVPSVQALALPLLVTPRLASDSSSPGIDEDCDDRVLDDPRDFPSFDDFALVPTTIRRVEYRNTIG